MMSADNTMMVAGRTASGKKSGGAVSIKTTRNTFVRVVPESTRCGGAMSGNHDTVK
jgi:hypothetical protein